MKALVTGATGFLGGSLVRRLHGMGWDVTGLGRNPKKLNELEDVGVHPFRSDISKKDQFLTRPKDRRSSSIARRSHRPGEITNGSIKPT